MGYLTTITIYNDALNSFEDNRLAFADAVMRGIEEANYAHKEVSVPCLCYANAISVQPSRHADDLQTYVHYGNSVMNINPHSKDFKDLYDTMPEVAQQYVSVAETIVEQANAYIKKHKPKK